MKYDLTEACPDCPFRRSTHFTFRQGRAEEIVYASSFSCHQTTTAMGRHGDHRKAQSCAGRMIVLEKEGQPDQMMRIAARLGLYDPTKLKMNDPDVFDEIEEFMDCRGMQ